MHDAELLSRAASAGIETRWQAFDRVWRDVDTEVVREVLQPLEAGRDTATDGPLMVTGDVDVPVLLEQAGGRFELRLDDGSVSSGVAEPASGGCMIPAVGRPGYHTLEIGGQVVTLAIAPARCWTVADATQGARSWGLAVQLYALRRSGDGGIGDFTALERLVGAAGSIGCDALAISPIHAQFAADAGHISPYSPSSRSMWNGLYADPGAMVAGETPPQPSSDGLLDWRHAWTTRLRAFRRDFASMHAEAGGQLASFHAFRGAHGTALENHAVFETLHAHYFTAKPSDWDWHGWAAGHRDPDSAEVAGFAREHASEVSFHAYLQFRADEGLRLAQAAARAAGMRVGLISDIAIGVSPGGSDAWGRQTEMLEGLTIGAPPDLLNTSGQDWGVTTFSPTGLVRNGYRTFLDMLRTALRHAGGVRLDHVMGLARLWVVPRGRSGAEGAYLRFPLDDILRLVRLESWRHQAIVLGEDLGTLPDGFQERLRSNGLSGMRVLWFQRDAAGFFPPRSWPKADVAMTSTHDLPTVAGWWAGRDLDWRGRLGQTVTATERETRR